MNFAAWKGWKIIIGSAGNEANSAVTVHMRESQIDEFRNGHPKGRAGSGDAWPTSGRVSATTTGSRNVPAVAWALQVFGWIIVVLALALAIAEIGRPGPANLTRASFDLKVFISGALGGMVAGVSGCIVVAAVLAGLGRSIEVLAEIRNGVQLLNERPPDDDQASLSASCPARGLP